MSGMWIDVVLCLIAVGLLYLSAEALVGGSTRLAKALGVPALVVGLTVVAFGTSAPELVVSLLAASRDQIPISLGNIIGSNVANIGLIIGLVSLFRPMPANPALLRRDLPVLCGTMALYFALAYTGSIGRPQGALLFLGIIAYTTLLTRQAIRHANPKKIPAVVMGERSVAGNRFRDGALVVAGLGGLVLAGHLLVTSATGMARALGMSEWVIGVTLVALGTSIPEIATSFVAVFRGHPDIALGNAIGSNIFNVLLIQGVVSLYRPVPISSSLLLFEFPLMLGLSLFLFLMLRIRPRVGRWQGALLLLAYLGFIWVKVLNPA